MKQSPSNFRYRKNHKPGRFFLQAFETKTFFLAKGTFALKALAPGRLTFKHIEAGRRAIRRTVTKGVPVFIRVFPHASLTKRSLGMRMGKGKGAHFLWVCPVRAGQIIYELLNVPSARAWLALRKAADKMPFKSSIVKLNY